MASELLEWSDIVGGDEEGFRIKWDTVSRADFSLYAHTVTPDLAANDTDYVLTGLNAGTTYYWRVVGLVGGAEQTPSDESSFVAAEVVKSPVFSTRRLRLGVWVR